MYLFIIIIIVFGIDAVNGNEIYADLDPALFCPSNNSCSPPSSHILCTEHDPKLKRGPKCKDLEERPFTAALVKNFLDWINGIKARMSTGTFKVSDGTTPRGYGVFRVQWDPELAALSRYRLQICDNTGETSHARCSLSGRFPKQVQTTIGLGGDKITNAEKQVQQFKNQYNVEIAKYVTKAKVMKIDFDTSSNRFGSIAFLQGHATHIGCSMGAFTDSQTKKGPKIYCIISHFTAIGEPLYNMTPPVKGTGLSPECGCPLHYRESEGCLCEEWRPDTTSTYATYRTFKPLSGLPSDQIQWKRGIPDKSISLDNRVTKRDPEIFLPIINIEKGGPAYSNIWELLYNNLRNVVMPSGSQPEPLSTHTSQPNSMETLHLDGMVKNAYNGPSTQAVTPLYYKDRFINDILDKYTKPSKQTTDPKYNKDIFIYDITDRNINSNKQAQAQQDSVSYREVLFDDVMKAIDAKSNKKDGIIKTPAEIIESLESKKIDSLEKIVSDYNKFVTRRSAVLYDKKTENDSNRAYDPPPADASDIPQVDTSDIPQVDTFDIPQVDTSDIPQVDTSDIPQVDTFDIPQVDTFDIPQVDTSDIPQVDTSDIPQVDTSDIPQVDTSDIPQVDTSDIPQVDTSDIPQVDTSDIPQVDTFDHLPEDASNIPPVYRSDPPPTDTDFEDTILL